MAATFRESTAAPLAGSSEVRVALETVTAVAWAGAAPAAAGAAGAGRALALPAAAAVAAAMLSGDGLIFMAVFRKPQDEAHCSSYRRDWLQL
jgi:hypothetical protein